LNSDNDTELTRTITVPDLPSSFPLSDPLAFRTHVQGKGEFKTSPGSNKQSYIYKDWFLCENTCYKLLQTLPPSVDLLDLTGQGMFLMTSRMGNKKFFAYIQPTVKTLVLRENGLDLRTEDELLELEGAIPQTVTTIISNENRPAQKFFDSTFKTRTISAMSKVRAHLDPPGLAEIVKSYLSDQRLFSHRTVAPIQDESVLRCSISPYIAPMD
jgi:hypothetical protein